MSAQLKGLGFFVDKLKTNALCILINIDLAKEQGQDEKLIPFEEHSKFSSATMFDIIGSTSTKSVIDIRELQFEQCLHSNHRKEVDNLLNSNFLLHMFVL